MVVQVVGRTLSVFLAASMMNVSSSEGDGSLDGVCEAGQDCEGPTEEWRQGVADASKLLIEAAHAMADDEVELAGMTFKVSNSVYHPIIFYSGAWYRGMYDVLDVIKICGAGGKFLEMGAGSGYFSVQAAKDGCMVTALDINPQAIKDTKFNAERFGVADRVTCLESDVYNALAGSGEKFDVIWWHHPYSHRLGDELPKWQKSNLMDEDYKLLGRFLGEGGKYLKPDGKLMVMHSKEWGNRTLFNHRMAESGATSKIVHTYVNQEEYNGVFISMDFFEVRYTK